MVRPIRKVIVVTAGVTMLLSFVYVCIIAGKAFIEHLGG